MACPGTPIDAATVSAFAARELPRYAQPDRILLLDALPKTPTGNGAEAALARDGGCRIERREFRRDAIIDA